MSITRARELARPIWSTSSRRKRGSRDEQDFRQALPEKKQQRHRESVKGLKSVTRAPSPCRVDSS